jgi:predicted GNAT family N-acyltransferase
MTAPTHKSDPPRAPCPVDHVEIIQAGTASERLAALEIRRRVFALEQGAADLRVGDPDDDRSLIALALLPGDDGDQGEQIAVSTGRLTPPRFRGDQALVAWVATLPEWRGHGIASALMRFLLAASDRAGVEQVGLAAQLPAESLYRRLGFRPAGPVYDVRGIPHRRMVRYRPG